MADLERGAFKKGYYYKGGDPADKANWVKPPAVGEIRGEYSYKGGAPFDKNSWAPISMGGEGGPKTAAIPGEAQARGYLTGVADSATVGYLPQIAGTIEAGVGELGEAIGLAEPKTFGERKAEVVKRFEDYEKETREAAPVAATLGDITGYAAPAKGLGLLAKGAKGLMASKGLIDVGTKLPKAVQVAGQMAGVGAESAAIAGLQDQEGGLEERARNAGTAFLTGAGFAGGSKVLGALGDDLYKAAQAMRIKGAGAMLKDFRNIYGRGQLDKIDNFLKTNKIVGPGSTVASVAKKANQIKQDAGAKLAGLYKQAKDKLNSPDFMAKLTPDQQDKYLNAGFYPSSQKDEILSSIKNKLGMEQGADGALKQVEGYLNQIVRNYGDDLDIVTAREIKSAIDRTINYARNPQNKDPIKEQAFKELRRFVSQKIDDQVAFLDDVLDGTGKKALKELNDKYGSASTVVQMASDKFFRENSNRLMGLSEQIMGGAAGLGYGIYTGDPISAVGYGLLGAGASRFGKKYGPGFGAPLMEGGSKAMQGAGGLLRRTAPAIAPTYQKENP